MVVVVEEEARAGGGMAARRGRKGRGTSQELRKDENDMWEEKRNGSR